MPQRVTARPQEFFEIRSVDARLDSRGARYVVDFEHLVQAIEIDRHRGVAACGTLTPHTTDVRPPDGMTT